MSSRPILQAWRKTVSPSSWSTGSLIRMPSAALARTDASVALRTSSGSQQVVTVQLDPAGGFAVELSTLRPDRAGFSLRPLTTCYANGKCNCNSNTSDVHARNCLWRRPTPRLLVFGRPDKTQDACGWNSPGRPLGVTAERLSSFWPRGNAGELQHVVARDGGL